jgi:hypothetical protein
MRVVADSLGKYTVLDMGYIPKSLTPGCVPLILSPSGRNWMSLMPSQGR